MNSNRCYSCGLLNFTSASTCKRCKAEFEESGNSGVSNYAMAAQGGHQAMPGWPQAESQPYYPPPPYFSGPIAPLPRASKNGATNAVLWVMLCITLVIAFGIGAAWRWNKGSSANYVWQEYQAADKSYSVLMPVKPEESIERRQSPAGELQLHLSMANLGTEGACLVGYVDYPDNFRSVASDELLDAGAKGAVATSGSTLLSKKKITLDGYPGLELELQPPAGQIRGGGRAKSRIYWVPPRLYMMFAGVPDSPANNATVMKFLDSFKLRKRETHVRQTEGSSE